MLTIFLLGLKDTYTCEQLFQFKPEEGKTTISFKILVSAASEIPTAKANVAKVLNTSVCAMSTERNKPVSHNASGFTGEVRKKHCKVYSQACNKCQKVNHLAAACKSDEIKKQHEEGNKKKASVKEVTVVEVAPAAAAAVPPAAAAPAAVLNLVQAVTLTQQLPYVFNPEGFSGVSDDFWSVSRVTPIQTKQL